MKKSIDVREGLVGFFELLDGIDIDSEPAETLTNYLREVEQKNGREYTDALKQRIALLAKAAKYFNRNIE